MIRTQLAVIGAGPGGYAAAFMAADLGLGVVLIDRDENPGGVCLYRGCIPSKALLHVARVIEESKQAAEWGVTFPEPRLDLERIRGWKTEVVEKLTGGLGELARRRKVRYLRGTARFASPETLEVQGGDGGRETVKFEHAIIASGSRPATIPGLPEGSARVWDSTAALSIPEVPKRLLVVGGGYIGLELGSVYAALGSAVTVVEMLGSLLPGVDGDLVRPLARKLEGILAGIHLETKVARVTEKKNGLRVELEGTGADASGDYEAVLVAVGRRPVTDGLGLETTRVAVNARGFIEVDAQRRTAETAIFAIGDAAGEPMLAHKASHEGRVAAEVAAGHRGAFDPRAIPAVVFTDPEIAWAGLTEAEAKRTGRTVEIGRFPWAASGRALTLGRADGVTKILVDPESKRVLGVGVCGPGAGELIAEGVLAVEMGATARDLDLSIHAHPTLSETVMEAAAGIFGTPTHVMRPKRGSDGS
jgi:dihydrolipoamide dehydrogenase